MSRRSHRSLSDASSGYKLVPLDEDQEMLNMPVPAMGIRGWPDPQAWGGGGALGSISVVESTVYGAHREPWWSPEAWHKYTWEDFLAGNLVQSVTVILIFGNAITIGFETDLPDALEWDIVENAFLVAFTMELSLRLFVLGPSRFFRIRNNPDITWNIFDFSIVIFGLVNVLASAFLGNKSKVGKDATLFRMIRLLRILRVLRIIRIVRFLKQLYLLAYGFIEGTMAVFWVTLLASFALYICAVILVRTYGRLTLEEDPNADFFTEHFGNIPRTMFNLFELLAAPDLVPYRAIMFEYPPLVIFLVSFIILGSFGINGLLVALINESILEKNQARLEADRIEREGKRKLMQQRCREVFDAIDVNKNRVLPRSEIMKCKGAIMQLFETSGVNFRSHDLDQMFYIMDYNDTGIIERNEFVQGVVELCDQIRPMSIMELHYQVSKCASKVESCDAKMDSVVKAVEDVGVTGKQTMQQAENLVARLSEMLKQQQGGWQTKLINPDWRGASSAPDSFDTSGTSQAGLGATPVSRPWWPNNLQEKLGNLQRSLSEAETRAEAFQLSELSRLTAADLSELGTTFFRLQSCTTEVLESLFRLGYPGMAGVSDSGFKS